MKIVKMINSKIRYKLIFGFVFISFFVWVVSYLSFGTIRHIKTDYDLISTKSIPIIQHLESMKFACLRLVSSASEYAYIKTEGNDITTESPLAQENNLILQACKQCHQAFSRYEQLTKVSNPELKKNTNEIRKLGYRVHFAALEFIEMKKLGISGTKALDKKEEMEVDEMSFLEVVNRTIGNTHEGLEREKSRLETSISTFTRNIIIFSGLTFFLSILFGIFYSRTLTKTVTKLTKQADDFSKGNLDVAIEIKTTDEIGMLGKSFNRMAERIKLLIVQLENEITIAKSAEEALRVSEERYKMVSDLTSDYIFKMGIDSKRNFTLDFMSESFYTITGLQIDQVKTFDAWAKIFHPDDVQKVIQFFQLFTTPQKTNELECRSYVREGKLRDIHINAQSHWNESEKRVDSIIGTVKDITERKQAEEKLRIYEQIFKSVNDIINVADLNDDILLANPAFCKMYGYSEEEIIGANSSIFWSERNPREVVEQILPATINGGWRGELINKKKDGTEFPIYLSTSVIKNNLGEQIAVVGVVEDITKRKEVELLIQQQNEELKELNAAKDKFFSIIAHDLRSPFQGFLTITEMMSQGIREFSYDDLAKLAVEMNKSAKNIYVLLENLLSWAQIQRGTMDFNVEELDLKKLVDQNNEANSTRATQKEITIINEVPEDLKVLADESMMNVILRNLISNALKFTRREGKITINAKPTADDMIEICVSDTGIGMPESTIGKLFKIDEKIGRKGTDKEPTTGIGLLLCKEFVTKHGGKIWAKSEEEKGSNFYFTVPVAKQ